MEGASAANLFKALLQPMTSRYRNKVRKKKTGPDDFQADSWFSAPVCIVRTSSSSPRLHYRPSWLLLLSSSSSFCASFLISPRQTDGRTERGHGRNLGPWLGHVVFEERRFLRGTLIAQKHGETKPERSSRLKSALPGGGVTLQRLQRARAGAGRPSVDTRQGAASTAARLRFCCSTSPNAGRTLFSPSVLI